MQTVKLLKPIQMPRGPVSELTFREPTYADYMVLGDPFTWVEVAGGGSYLQEMPAVIDKYARKLVKEDENLMDDLPLPTAMAIRDVILGFFRDARSAGRSAASTEASRAT